jgi:hypothetical protein
MTKVSGPGNARFSSKAETRKMIATAAVTKGDVYSIDRSVVDATSLEFTTMHQSVAADDDSFGGVQGVALEDIAAGESGLWGFRGKFECLVNGAIALEDSLGIVTAQDYLDQAAATFKIIALPLEAQTGGLALCEFDGISGFGQLA